MFYVYILKCADGTPYTGCTNDLKDRVKRHIAGYVDATKSRLPIELENYLAFKDEKIAFRFEKYLKSGSGRAFSKKHFTK
jgi:predicted GIY-YIG superfamily endonuclease